MPPPPEGKEAPAYLTPERILEVDSLVPRGLQLPVCPALVPELALQSLHLVTEPLNTQPGLFLRHLGLGVLGVQAAQRRGGECPGQHP